MIEGRGKSMIFLLHVMFVKLLCLYLSLIPQSMSSDQSLEEGVLTSAYRCLRVMAYVLISEPRRESPHIRSSEPRRVLWVSFDEKLL